MWGYVGFGFSHTQGPFFGVLIVRIIVIGI